MKRRKKAKKLAKGRKKVNKKRWNWLIMQMQIFKLTPKIMIVQVPPYQEQAFPMLILKSS